MPRFPSVEYASEEGMVRLGGKLTFPWLEEAYRNGIFPWPWLENGREVLGWFCPDPRAVLQFADFHLSRRAKRRIRQRQFQFSIDTDFDGVIAGCRQRPHEETWLTEQLADGYRTLFRRRHAHCIEVRQAGALVGGVLGVSFGGYFSAESMFSRSTDASKCGLAYLVHHLKDDGFSLLDAQVASDHTVRLGVSEIAREEFLRRLKLALDADVCFSQIIKTEIVDELGK